MAFPGVFGRCPDCCGSGRAVLAELINRRCLVLEDADRFLDDRRRLFEIGDEGDELLVGLRVG